MLTIGHNEKISCYGATGYIGSRLRELYPDIIDIEHRDSEGPVNNKVIFMASTNSNYNIKTNPHLDIDTNLNYLVSVLEKIKNSPRKNDIQFHFVSSWFVYGDTEYPAKEDSVCNPKGFYSITKRTAEQLLESYCETFGIKYRIYRLSNVYGRFDKTSSDQKNALHFLLKKICNNEEVFLYYGGDFYRDYIHVDDVCNALIYFVSRYPIGLKGGHPSINRHSIINIGSGLKYRFQHLIAKAIQIVDSNSGLGSRAPTDFHKIVQVKDGWLNVDKMLELGYYPQIGIDEGLKETVKMIKNEWKY